MGLVSFLKSKFSKPVSIKPSDDFLMLSPQSGKIDINRRLVVPEGYICLFVAREKVCDRFMPGEHKLSIENIPALTRVLKLNVPNKKGNYKHSFYADIYFVKLSPVINQKFCSQQGVYINKDKDFLNLTAFVSGEYSFEIVDPVLLIEALIKMYGVFNGKLAQRQIDIWTGELVDRKIKKNKPSVQGLFERDSTCFEGVVDYLNRETADIGLKYQSINVTQTVLPKNVYKKASLKYSEKVEKPVQDSQDSGLQINDKVDSLASKVVTNTKEIDFQIDILPLNSTNQTNQQLESDKTQTENNARQIENSAMQIENNVQKIENSATQTENATQQSEQIIVQNQHQDQQQYAENLAQTHQTLEQMQNKIHYKKCPHCEAFNASDANSCFNCKQPFKKVCGHCGAEIDSGNFVCPNCKSVVI